MYLASSKHSAASKTFTPTRSRVTAYAFRCGLRCWFALLAVAAVALAGAQAQAQINVIPVITTLANQYTNKGTTRNNEYALYDEFNSLDGIAIDGSGNIYVSDSLNNIIAEISGGYVYIIAGGGTPTTASTCSGSVDGYGDG